MQLAACLLPAWAAPPYPILTKVAGWYGWNAAWLLALQVRCSTGDGQVR